MDPTLPSIVGTTVDNFQITGVLGSGGMGMVYKARNLVLEKDVALKVMDPVRARDEGFRKHFIEEARSLARLDTPNIVRVFDLRETPLGMLIVMECVDGIT